MRKVQVIQLVLLLLLSVSKSSKAYMINIKCDSAELYLSDTKELVDCYDTILNLDDLYHLGSHDVNIDNQFLTRGSYQYIIAVRKGYKPKVKWLEYYEHRNYKEKPLVLELEPLVGKTEKASFIRYNKASIDLSGLEKGLYNDPCSYYGDLCSSTMEIIAEKMQAAISYLSYEYLDRSGYLREEDGVFIDTRNTLDLNVAVKFDEVDVNERTGVPYFWMDLEYELYRPDGHLFLQKTDSYKMSFDQLYKGDFFPVINDLMKDLVEDDSTLISKGIVDSLDLVRYQNWETICMDMDSSMVQSNANKIKQSVVTVSTKTGHGSGVVVSKDGYLVTNQHVVGDQDTVEVVFFNGDTLNVEVIRHEPYYDLALLKLNNYSPKEYLSLSDERYEMGDEILTVGTPIDTRLSQSFSTGYISNFHTNGDLSLIQYMGSVNPGNSGGALINRNGQLIGIVSQKLTGVGIGKVGFAIPVDVLKNTLMIDYE